MIRGLPLVPMLFTAALAVGACGDDTSSVVQTGSFESITVVSGLDEPTAFVFAPDERIFVAEKPGIVRVYKEGALLPEPLMDMRERVNAAEQRGLLGMEIDPNFEDNGFLYLFYTREHDPSDTNGPKTSQVVHVTVEGDTALPEGEQVILGSVTATAGQPSCNDFPVGADCLPADGDVHVGGGLQFASDGTLFVTTGDSAHFDELRIRAQDLDSLAGKVLRIHPDGTAPEDNPFFTGDPTENRSKAWAYGLREPFRLALQPETDLPFVGDVGSLYSEEISIAHEGANLGWPCFEGLEPPYAIGEHETCDQLRQSGRDTVTMPVHTYATKPAAAVVGGDFPSAYPEPYDGAFFFADYVRSWISYLTVDDDGELIDVQELPIDADGPVALKTGPDGEIYYLAWNARELRRLTWVSE